MERKLHPALRIVLCIITILILAAALVYFTGVVYFRTHFPFHTSFLGYDISQREVSAIDECMRAESDLRTLTILERGGEKETLYLSADIGYARSAAEPEGGWIPENDSWRWVESLWTETLLPDKISFRYDEEALEAAVASLDALDPDRVTQPVNARLEWQGDVCVMVPETEGDALYAYKVLGAVREAVDAEADTVDLEAQDCYREPTVRSDDARLNAVLDRYEAINFQQLEIDMTGETIRLTPQEVLSFYVEDGTGELILSEEAVAGFAAELKERFDTYERQRPFVNHYGNEILVGTRADTYGFKMDADATAAALTEAFEGKERLAQVEPVWINAGWVREENGSDIGDTYIEVSIAEQYLWAYIDGELILSTSVVTGNSGNHDTPRGVFRILYMERNATLVGEDYATPVSFWMPLTWSGVGLHDATWRGSFGGSIYTYNGSHGCVNMPYWAASDLYWSYYSGTPVVIW